MNTRSLLGAVTTSLVTLLAVSSASAANVSYNTGDLIIGFRSTNPTLTNSAEVNLGSASALRDNPDSFVSVNINGVLEAAFGAGWFTDNTIHWGIVATTYTSTVNGDPSSTNYFSQTTADVGFGPGDTALTITTTARSGLRTSINSFATGSGGFTSGTDLGGNSTLIANSETNSWAGKNNGSQSFTYLPGSTSEAQLGNGGDFSYVDLYRVLNTNTGATNPGTVGLSQYITTFALNSAGQLTAASSAVPEPSAYGAIAGVLALGVVASRRRRNA